LVNLILPRKFQCAGYTPASYSVFNSMHMKTKLLFFLLLLSTGFLLNEVKAQSLVITAKDGTETNRNLTALRSVSFVNNGVLLKSTNGNSESFSVANIKKISFKSGTTASELIASDQKNVQITLFPNPVDRELHLQNLPAGNSEVSVYRIDGTILIKKQVTSDENLLEGVSLNKGVYILRVKNQTFKFIKL
jgi:hypothetical protein